MPPDTASSLPPSRPPPPRASPPRATPSRITPPRISPPQVNANRVCSASHTPLKEEKMVQVKRAIPITKVSPPTPTSTRQSAAPDTENVPVRTQTQETPVIEDVPVQAQTREAPVIENAAVNEPNPPRNTGLVPLAPRDENIFAQRQQPRHTENIPVQAQAQEAPVIEEVVVDDPNSLPRNAGLVHLAPRDENIPSQQQQPRQRLETGKHKVKFSISCVTVSTSSSENEDDASDPFAPPAPSPSVTVAPQYQSLLTQSLRKHGLVMRHRPSTTGATDQASSSSQSRAPDRSTETAQTAGRINWTDPKLIRERDILVYGPFQRQKGKRYFDEPIPTQSSRPYPPLPPKPPQALPPSKTLKALPPSKPLKPLPPSKPLKHLPPSKPLEPLPPSKPLKPTAPPFPSEPSCPGLTPSSVAIPARVGRAPNRPPVDRPPPDRPGQQAEQARPPKVQASGQANERRRGQEGPPARRGRGRPPVDGECFASEFCWEPSLGSFGTNFCKFHSCHAILADGNRCPNSARPSYDEKVPVYCKRGYHKENGTYGRIDEEKRRGVLIAGQKKLQEESDLAWYAKLVAIVLPQEQPDIEVTPELFEELFYPDPDYKGWSPKRKAARIRREAEWTGILDDTSVRPVRKFLTMEHIMGHPKLKGRPIVVLTAEQEAQFLREAEGGLLPRITPVEEPKVAPPKPKSMFDLPPPLRHVEQQSTSRDPEWMYAVGFKKKK